MLEWRIRKLKRQLQESRFRLNHLNAEFAGSLYDMSFVATKDVWRMSTNGSRIYFDPDWLQKLGEVDLDFILAHEVMHISLGHIERPDYYLGDRYHLAADIVANARLRDLGWNYEKIPHIGKIRCETFYPTVDGALITSVEAVKYVPIDPSIMEPAKRRQLMIDSDEWWDRKDDTGESGTIVLSPADEDPEDLVYTGPVIAGNVRHKKEYFPKLAGAGGGGSSGSDKRRETPPIKSERELQQAIGRLRQQTMETKASDNDGGRERLWQESKAKRLNWRSILDAFVQEELYDYSFTPPDRRLQDMDFFLPDYNVYKETVKNIVFMVDTSGSVNDELLAIAFDEIRQAIAQFNGMISGVVAFFDNRVYAATPFANIEDIKRLRPLGGGGTDYNAVFQFINNSLSFMPSSIVIITDGEGGYPPETVANSNPVLWMITGENKSPWGRCIKI